VRLEERIMIGAEMPRCVLTMGGGVEHTADVGAIDGTTMHADSHEATGELVHDHELYPARTHEEHQWSCGYWLETILVVQSAGDWRRDDAMAITNLTAA
jgi:hypothetical protein